MAPYYTDFDLNWLSLGAHSIGLSIKSTKEYNIVVPFMIHLIANDAPIFQNMYLNSLSSIKKCLSQVRLSRRDDKRESVGVCDLLEELSSANIL